MHGGYAVRPCRKSVGGGGHTRGEHKPALDHGHTREGPVTEDLADKISAGAQERNIPNVARRKDMSPVVAGRSIFSTEVARVLRGVSRLASIEPTACHVGERVTERIRSC